MQSEDSTNDKALGDDAKRNFSAQSFIKAFQNIELVSVPFHTSGRAKPHSAMYFRMCCDAVVEYRMVREACADNFLLDPRFIEKNELLEIAAVKPIVFAGMCLEATLFDLSACLFGDEFAASIERLDPLGKFAVLAQCVDRELPSPSHVAYQSIKQLVTMRNRLVHYKSERVPDSGWDAIMERAKKEKRLQCESVDRSFKTLVLLSLYFDGNIFEELRILPSFKKPEYWIESVPRPLHADVHHCIAAAKRASMRKQHGVESTDKEVP